MQVDFYLLNSITVEDKLLFACKLVEKAYKLGHQVFIYCQNIEETHALDDLLWSFKPESFIPHNIQGEGPEPPPTIQLGYTSEPRGFNEILLNLNHKTPSFYRRFSRIMEIVTAEDTCKDHSRQRYREYKKQGLSLKTHEISS